MKLLKAYKNGNAKVRIWDDGTREIEYPDNEELNVSFPLSIDFKITNWCDQGCPMCHEMSNINGLPGDIMNEKFIDTLHPGTEIAIGGGKATSHPELLPFLRKLKEKGVIANITVHQNEFVTQLDLINQLIDEDLIHGLGISFKMEQDVLWKAISENENVVVHLIAGLHGKEVFDYLSQFGVKILILGYKNWGRGAELLTMMPDIIQENIDWLKNNLKEYMDKFEVISFDNLALNQLDIKSLLTEEQWKEFYQGNDGTATMYIDGVKKEFAKTSTSKERYPMLDTIEDMFNVIKEENKNGTE